MKPDEIKQHLTAEEWENYHAVCEMLKISTNRSIPDMDFLTDQKSALGRLAAERQQNAEYRRLMEKHEWGMLSHGEGNGWYCPECGMIAGVGHAPNCLWAQAIHTDGPSGTIGKGE